MSVTKYDFQPRIPFDYAIQLAKIIKGSEPRDKGTILQLVGAITGEAGALMEGAPPSFGAEAEFIPSFSADASVVEQETVLADAILDQGVSAPPVGAGGLWLALALKLAKLLLENLD